MFLREIESEFEAALKNSAGQSFDYSHPEKGPRGETLKTLFHLLPGDPERLLVSVSGTHGPEGYIGSQIQTEILRQLTTGPKPGPTILFVHNLNPYGSAWVRRMNHQNVDLNRNSWKGTPPRNPDFHRYLPWLSSKTPAQFWWNLVKHLPSVPRLGMQHISEVIARGQSEEPRSLFYTGISQAPELENLVRVLKNYDPRFVGVLDIHTGLGPAMHESLMLETLVPEEVKQKLEAGFSVPAIDVQLQTAFYVAEGGLGHLFRACFPEAVVCHFTEEFGTDKSIKVLEKMVLENSAWQQGDPQLPARFKHLLEIFFPSSREWNQTVRRAGVQRFFELAKSLTQI